jgi:peptidoglycan/xylan/chitin deacetylase (PgdA/CDA1 family)
MTLVPILLYHSISERPSAAMRPFTVLPATFRAHLDAVADSGAAMLTVSEFVDRRESRTLPARPAVITFDDGFADFAEHALPALAHHRLRATLYAATGFLAGCPGGPARARPEDPALDWSQLREIHSQGIEIGAHTHGHPHLDTLAPPAARDEISGCKTLLQDELGHAVESFAYPNGYSSATVRRLVREAGYRSACAVRNTFSSTSDDRFALARLTVRDTTTADDVAAWLACSGARPPRRRERVATKAWRVYRRTRAVASGTPGSDFRTRYAASTPVPE